jgi:hypothetical protein
MESKVAASRHAQDNLLGALFQLRFRHGPWLVLGRPHEPFHLDRKLLF